MNILVSVFVVLSQFYLTQPILYDMYSNPDTMNIEYQPRLGIGTTSLQQPPPSLMIDILFIFCTLKDRTEALHGQAQFPYSLFGQNEEAVITCHQPPLHSEEIAYRWACRSISRSRKREACPLCFSGQYRGRDHA